MKKISKLNGLILIGVFLVLMYMIYNLNILPFRYFLIIGGILLLFVLLFVFKLVRDKTGFISRILFNILSIVFIAGQIYLMTYINATKDFMNSLVAKNFEEVTYDVVVNSNGSMDHMGDLYNKENVPVYAAPGRLTDFSGLPPAFSYVGSIEPFYDETIAYMEGLKQAGIPVHYQVFDGCFHGFDIVASKSPQAKQAKAFLKEQFEYAMKNYYAVEKASEITKA